MIGAEDICQCPAQGGQKGLSLVWVWRQWSWQKGRERDWEQKKAEGKGKKPWAAQQKEKVKKCQALAFQRMENCSLSWVRCWEHPLRRRRDTDSPGKQRGFSPRWLQRGFRWPWALVELRRGQNLRKEIEEGSQGWLWVWHTMGKEGWDRAGDRRLEMGFDIW